MSSTQIIAKNFKACDDTFIVEGRTQEEAYEKFHKEHGYFPNTIYLEENGILTPVWVNS